MNNFNDEVPKYKKKSKSKTPEKAKHKHDYQDCVYEWDNPTGKFDRDRGFVPRHEIMGGTYCSICGKIGQMGTENFNWYVGVKEAHSYFGYVFSTELSERAKQEINPETRTLPTFYLYDNWKQKFIELE